MAEIFGVDLDEIDTNKLVKDDHIETIYGVLSGDPNYSSEDHVINFTGSFLAGKNNEKGVNVDFGFAFGKNNRAASENSFVVGEDGESYAEHQFVLSGGSISSRGDSQRVSSVRSFSSTSGGEGEVVIPTKNNVISSIKIRISGAEENSFADNSVFSAEYDLIYINSREDPDTSDRVGKILFLERNWFYGSLLNNESTGFNVKFEVKNNHKLKILVDDNRPTGDDVNWTVYIDSVETYAGQNIQQFGSQGYGVGYISDSGQSGYEDPILGCFIPSMKVSILNSSGDFISKKMSQLDVGDELYSFNIDNEDYTEYSKTRADINKLNETKTTVTDIFYGFVSEIFEINESVKVSGSQPVFVYDSVMDATRFVEVSNINKKSMYLLNKDKKLVDIKSLNKIRGDTEVISIDVERSDVFFVKNILFHNKH